MLTRVLFTALGVVLVGYIAFQNGRLDDISPMLIFAHLIGAGLGFGLGHMIAATFSAFFPEWYTWEVVERSALVPFGDYGEYDFEYDSVYEDGSADVVYYSVKTATGPKEEMLMPYLSGGLEIVEREEGPAEIVMLRETLRPGWRSLFALPSDAERFELYVRPGASRERLE